MTVDHYNNSQHNKNRDSFLTLTFRVQSKTSYLEVSAVNYQPQLIDCCHQLPLPRYNGLLASGI